MPTLNCITSLCGAGLEAEYRILKAWLEPLDWKVFPIHFTGGPNERMEPADINVFLEVVCAQALYLSKINLLFPNSEQWYSINDQYLPRFTKICCKTQDCYRIWSNKVSPEKCIYTSFEARDLYDPSIPRKPVWLHIAGKSDYKGTDVVIEAWQKADLPPLTIVCSVPQFKDQWKKNPRNITWIDRCDEMQLKKLINESSFHILPSKYEGFGHCIHEAIGCGGLVSVPYAPPTNEISGVFGFISVRSNFPRLLVQMNTILADDIIQLVQNITQSPYPISAPWISFREKFLENREFFRQTFLSLLRQYVAF